MLNPAEVMGLLFTLCALGLLLHFGKRRKHAKAYPMTVSFWCNWSGEQYVTPVRNLYHAQNYINKLNLAGVAKPCVYENGEVTYTVAANGVWAAVP